MAKHSREEAKKATVAVGLAVGGATVKTVKDEVDIYKHNKDIDKKQNELKNEYWGLGGYINSGEIKKIESQRRKGCLCALLFFFFHW